MLAEIDDDTFAENVACGLSMVLFYKEQCPYCRAMKKIITKFAQMPAAREQRIKTFQIDREANARSVEELGVDRTPSLFIFRNGQKVACKSGDVTYRDLERMIAC